MDSYDYNYALGKGFFSGQKIQNIPTFNDYQRDFHSDFLRYLYFMCIMNSRGEYPVSVSIDSIIDEFKKSANHDIRPIKKILIGEAPPAQSGTKSINYFYNPKWSKSSPWITAPMKAMSIPKFANKIDFLIACSKQGFLLLDLFPYAISYKPRSDEYSEACISAFSFSQPNRKIQSYPHSIMNTLNLLLPWINSTLVIGFGLKAFGEFILTDKDCINDFNSWASNNSISLYPYGSIDIKRPIAINGASDYLRVCKFDGPMGPHSILLNLAGF